MSSSGRGGCGAPARREVLAGLGTMLLAACQTAQPPPPPEAPQSEGRWLAGWQPFVLPGKRATGYSAQRIEGRWVLHAESQRSASMFRRRVRVEPDQLGHITFSWKVTSLIEGADVRANDTEDSPVRVMLAFDGDHSRLSQRNRMMFELMHSLTGEPPPFATLMYLWDGQAPVDALVVNQRSDRVRKIVVESGPARLGQWRSYRRDIAADFRRAFGEAPGALIGIAVMTDSDNTQSSAEAWYGEIRIE